ncbi:MAG: T9SS type A sorting domain-containing protein [Vicingaceae bacterium]
MKPLSKFILPLFITFSITGFTQTTDSFTTPGAHTWTCPAGVTSVTVTVYGGGGGGGGCNATSDGGGGGGGGGASQSTGPVTPGNVYNLMVGAGGAGGVGQNDGAAGGQSWFNAPGTIQANGGSGGLRRTASGGLGGAGAAAGIGTNTFTGGNGRRGRNHNNGRGGAGGGGAGSTANGGGGATTTYSVVAGTGGATGGGNGGAGGTGNGANGLVIGGGGAGAGEGTNRSGGNGARGQVNVTYTLPGGGAGDNCANPTRIACGDPVLAGETTIGLTDVEDDWACSTLLGANNYPGSDHFYVIQWPDAVNGGTIRLEFTNVADADATYLEVLSLGNSCAPDACVGSSQMTIATGNFGTGNSFIEFTVGAGVTDYYFVVDSQGDGVDDAIDTYDIQATCFATGIELDDNSNCTPIPGTAAANQGYYATWDGAEPPATANAATLAAAGPYTICENIYIENPLGWEWLKDFDVTLGACWINVNSLTPNGNNNGFYNALGDWTATIGGGSPNVLNWNFAHSSNPTWGDGAGPGYNCNLYTFCYTADVDATCNVNTGLQNSISATDDGVGGGGGGAVNANNITVGSTSPTVLPVELITFSASPKEKNGKYAVILNWRTATEINNDYFTIERSSNGRDFEEVAKVSAVGNSSDINNYITVDEKPYEGLSYYRLKQTDFNGKFEYFDLVAVNISNVTDLKVYPNPVSSEMTISMRSKLDNSFVKLNIYNTQGELILQQDKMLSEGMNAVEINMAEYAQGLYFVSLEHNGKKEHVKFSKK